MQQQITVAVTRRPEPALVPDEVVVVVPVFNERDAVLDVLAGIEAHGYHRLVVIDDGSTDGSTALLLAWAESRPAATLLALPRNRGKSAALRQAWDYLRGELAAGTVAPGTLIACIDADGQHDLAYLDTLLTRARETGADAVIAKRDLSYHGRYKRFGNHVMAAAASVCAGTRLHDVESGYRIVRLGPLLHAQDFYNGRRYSECAELAIVLARLGYLVDNGFGVVVPVARSRTHLSDAVAHLVTMLGAWVRVACWRTVPARFHSPAGAAAAVALLLAFALFTVRLLTHAVYLGNDSGQSYAHVWLIEQALRAGDLSLRVPQLEHGQAFLFPYATLPWLPTALLRPLLGDWAVTASMGVGLVLLVVGLRRWLPSLRSALALSLVLLNWQLWNGVLQFQLPTIWALAFACFAAAEWRRERAFRGIAYATAALFAHPLMGGIALGVVGVDAVLRSGRVTWQFARGTLVAAVLALPAAWMFFTTSSVETASAWSPAMVAGLVAQRSSMLWWPLLVDRLFPSLLRVQLIVLLLGAALLARNVWASNPQNLNWESQPRFPDYIEAGLVQPDVRYRVLTMSDQEDGMLQLLQHGAHFTHSFFDESVARHNFGTEERYGCFLAAQRAERVLVQHEWVVQNKTDEVALLHRLTEAGKAHLAYVGAAGTREYRIVAPAAELCPTPQ